MIIKPSFQGKVRCVLKDENGNIKQDTGYSNNMLVDSFLEKLFTENTQGWLNWSYYGRGFYPSVGDRSYMGQGLINYTKISSSTDPTTRGMTDMTGSTPDETHDYGRSTSGTFPVWVERQFVYLAGNGTGDINAVGVFKDNNDMTARIILPETIEKLSTDILEVYYRVEFDIPTRTYSGVIEKGQRDGETDINWNLYITDDMVYNAWVDNDMGRTYSGGTLPTRYYVHNVLNGLYGLYTTNGVDVIIGDSNAPSDIQNDNGSGAGHLKGNEIYNGKWTFLEPNDYVSGSYQRTGRLGFEEDIANVEISELLVFPQYSDKASPTFRITFDPALNNVEMYRLYLDFTVSLGTIS